MSDAPFFPVPFLSEESTFKEVLYIGMSWRNYIKHCRHFGPSWNFTADMQSYRARFPAIQDPETLWDAMVDHEIAYRLSKSP